MKIIANASMPGSALALLAIPDALEAPELERLTEEERKFFGTLTTDRRRAEWWAGRVTAHAALEALGAPPVSILADKRGVPRLLGEGNAPYFISISHGRRVAAAAATRENAAFPCIGIDVVDPEDAERIDKIAKRFLTETERALLQTDPRAAMLAWGAREAIAKATSTGMFAFALKKGAILAVDYAAARIRVELEEIEVVFVPIEGDGLAVLAGTTRAIAASAQKIAGLENERHDP
jgi:4'-phosphopantetheinyl transferase EntD